MILLIFPLVPAFSSTTTDTLLISRKLFSLAWLSSSVMGIIAGIIGSILVMSALVIYFSMKLRRINRELHERNEEILRVNSDLQNTNKKLLVQKEHITKEHSESDKFYGMLLQAATDGISFYDRAWNLIYANNAFYSTIGLDQDKYNSYNTLDLFHSDDKDYEERRAKALNNNGFFESEIRLKHKEGHMVNLSTRSVAVRSDTGDVLGALTISRDITKLKDAQEGLIRANKDAEASSRLKSSFLANISHEIRTPLNSVVGFSNLLMTNGLTREAREEYVEHINHNSEKLLQIIGDIIDLSRLESSQIEITYEEASVGSIVNEIIEEARQAIKRNEKSIILNVSNQFENSSDLIFTDKIWLKRVLSHLMDNAIKFTLDGSVELSYFLKDGNLVFRIKDTGIGINKENLIRIFEQFRQEIDGHHRPFEGLGIGLTLAKEVVEKMGGNIFVESEKGIGSEFSFYLPYRPAGSGKARIKPALSDIITSTINWSSRKCLIVDDNKDVLIYLSRILGDTGVTIFTARSGKEAIEYIQTTPDIDVVLLDMQMPEMNGIEVTKEIRRIRKTIPIIAQTAFIFEDDKDIIIEAGCDACLLKPIRKDHLLTVMSSFVKSE